MPRSIVLLIRVFSFIILILLNLESKVFANEESPFFQKYQLSIQYLGPSNSDRNIKTLNVGLNVPVLQSRSSRMAIFLNIAGTYATGNISQLIGGFDEGTLREIQLDNEAFGIGPGLLLDYKLLDIGKLKGSLEAAGNIFFYDEEFPAGGDRYNFMVRVGPALAYRVNRLGSFGLSYSWAHVSNGQGVSLENPSYDAQGLSIRWARSF